MNVEEGIQLGDLAGMLRRRWSIVAFAGGAILLVAIFIASILPNEYMAAATILVEPQLISKQLVAGGLEETDLNSRLNLMTAEILSRPRLSRIIDDFGLYPEESHTMTREEVIVVMREDLQVVPLVPELFVGKEADYKGRIDTFRIQYRSESARRSADVANRLANDFIEAHIKERVQVAGDTSEFIENELARITTRMRDLEDQRGRVHQENIGHLPSDLDSNQRRLTQAYESLRFAQRELAEAQSDLTFWDLQTRISETGKERDDGSPTRQLDLLELQLAEYRARGYTDKHPNMLKLRENIQELQAKIAADESAADLESEEAEEDRVRTPNQQMAEAQVNRVDLRVASAREEVGRLEEQIADLEDRVAQTPSVLEALASIEREAEHQAASFQEYSQKRLEANVAANMERRQKGEQFRVLESAFLPSEASSPNRPLIVVLGLFLGVAFGAGMAVLLEAIDTSFHDPRRLQTALRIPVLASIPAILLEADLRALRRRRMRTAFASLLVTGFMLSSSAVGYVYVNGAPGFIQAIVSGEADEAPAADGGE